MSGETRSYTPSECAVLSRRLLERVRELAGQDQDPDKTLREIRALTPDEIERIAREDAERKDPR